MWKYCHCIVYLVPHNKFMKKSMFILKDRRHICLSANDKDPEN